MTAIALQLAFGGVIRILVYFVNVVVQICQPWPHVLHKRIIYSVLLLFFLIISVLFPELNFWFFSFPLCRSHPWDLCTLINGGIRLYRKKHSILVMMADTIKLILCCLLWCTQIFPINIDGLQSHKHMLGVGGRKPLNVVFCSLWSWLYHFMLKCKESCWQFWYIKLYLRTNSGIKDALWETSLYW